MVKITNGKLTTTVTKGAYDSIYVYQGFTLVNDTEHGNNFDLEEWNNGTDKDDGQ